jgi:two-component system, chemotaxis family, CheB/CheR fusion protein
MRKLMTTSTILEHELSELRLLVERHTGVALDCPNSALAAHVADYVETRELGSSATLLERLRASDPDTAKLSSLLDGLIDANTGFFRHPGALNALAQHVVPQLCARKSIDGPSPLRIWSAGCGTGEEAYSIAMAVCDSSSLSATTPANIANASNGNGTGNQKSSRSGGIAESSTGGSTIVKSAAPFSLHIVGSDLLPRNIEAADRGVYPQSALDGLPPATIRNYFSKITATSVVLNQRQGESVPRNGASASVDTPRAEAGHLLVKPRLRSLVTFNCMNLARPSYIGRFDIIFCMDVLPHFSRAQRIALLERLHLYLEPGGYLFLSQTEKLINSNLNFRSETFDGYTFHRKPLAASAAYGR